MGPEHSKTMMPQNPEKQSERKERTSARMSIAEIAARLALGRMAVYAMLEKRIIPGLRLGRRWIVTRHAFEEWERRCGNESFPLGTNDAYCAS
jgi:excisionase family DNA binding protein